MFKSIYTLNFKSLKFRETLPSQIT